MMEQHIFIIGSKSIGQYGGYETFVNKLSEYHQNEKRIKYHIACKANGDGYMDENKLSNISDIKKDVNGNVSEFTYYNSHVFKLKVPDIGSAVAIYYDIIALKYCIKYCQTNEIYHPIFYILACRIGPFMCYYKKQIEKLGGAFYLNPDGHEWKRTKWSLPIRKYWKKSEKLMIKYADLVICDSVAIEKYIKNEYIIYNPKTTFIAYGADTKPSPLTDDDKKFTEWLKNKGLEKKQYYLVVGRFIPENNYEIMIREFMKSHSKKNFAIISNVNDKFLKKLETKLSFRKDSRIKFVGTVYDQELLIKIRENAYGYFHGHEVGGTNPSLLEALASTKLNLLLNVSFNKEVAKDAAIYWSKKDGNLAGLIDRVDKVSNERIEEYGKKAKQRINDAYNWQFICNRYAEEFLKG